MSLSVDGASPVEALAMIPPVPAVPASSSQPSELRLFGYRLNPMSGPEVIARVAAAVYERRRLIMANLNVHGMAAMYDSPAMVRLHDQDDCQVMIDGMPLIMLSNLVLDARLDRSKRTTSLDFYDDLFARGEAEGWTFAYVGGEPWVLDAGLALLRHRFPRLSIGGRDGFFDIGDDQPGSRNSEVIDWLTTLSPDIVIVGMGMPKQEEWIERIQHLVDARVFLPTGAYLDYQVGAQRPAPRWMGRYGLEWSYRLLLSPHRLGYRYLIEPFVLAYRLLTKKPLPRGNDAPR